MYVHCTMYMIWQELIDIYGIHAVSQVHLTLVPGLVSDQVYSLYANTRCLFFYPRRSASRRQHKVTPDTRNPAAERIFICVFFAASARAGRGGGKGKGERFIVVR
jgi:hypothetical protein